MNARIVEHAFVRPTTGKDECDYPNCGQPELVHEWTVGAFMANPPLNEA